MDPDLIWMLGLAAALGSLATHYVAGRFLAGRLVTHLDASHEDGWRACGGSPRREEAPPEPHRAREGVSDYAAWRWLRASVRRNSECNGCAQLARSGGLLVTSAVSTTFLFLAIAEIWGH